MGISISETGKRGNESLMDLDSADFLEALHEISKVQARKNKIDFMVLNFMRMDLKAKITMIRQD